MLFTFTHQSATMLTQVLQQITPFHGTAPSRTRATRGAAVSTR
jgi:hypothetical protein